MPIYEYACKKCGQQIEVLQKMSDPPLRRCRTCGGGLERLLSPVGIHFKGSGWYVTDYARKSSSGNGETKPSDTKSETKTEPKAEAKADAKNE
ncbi:MAG: zinc ribbon domain-containing protein [Acidobacteria bacterium]|nr:zinc ribbon domain-containing protein [Acidobacteriota bacterium]